MKKNALVQLIIIYVGILTIYTAVSVGLISSAVGIIGNAFRLYYGGIGMLAGYLVFALLGCIAIAQSGNLSKFICDRAGLDDSLTVFTKPNQLLSIFIVTLALGHILDNLPMFLNNVYQTFFNEKRDSDDFATRISLFRSQSFLIDFLHILFPCLLIIFCRNLTAYFSKNIVLDDDDMVAVHETIELEGGNKPGA